MRPEPLYLKDMGGFDAMNSVYAPLHGQSAPRGTLRFASATVTVQIQIYEFATLNFSWETPYFLATRLCSTGGILSILALYT